LRRAPRSAPAMSSSGAKQGSCPCSVRPTMIVRSGMCISRQSRRLRRPLGVNHNRGAPGAGRPGPGVRLAHNHSRAGRALDATPPDRVREWRKKHNELERRSGSRPSVTHARALPSRAPPPPRPQNASSPPHAAPPPPDQKPFSRSRHHPLLHPDGHHGRSRLPLTTPRRRDRRRRPRPLHLRGADQAPIKEPVLLPRKIPADRGRLDRSMVHAAPGVISAKRIPPIATDRRVAQSASARFTRERSLVRAQPCPCRKAL
jgi:hypothetical protein